MNIWIEPSPIEIEAELIAAAGGDELAARMLAQRGISDAHTAQAFLDPEYYSPAPPETLPDLERAVERLEKALRAGELIAVWGDFDVDGQTATTLLFSALKGLGARVIYHIPVRAHESHGVNLPNLARMLDQGATLLLTCDTGIDASEAVAYAQSRGVDSLITDHHNLPERLPEALALVNPRFLPPDHSLSGLPGVGVAYKLAEALYGRAGRGEDCQAFLDLVALGIVADVAMQAGDTRYLLQRGLQVLRKTTRLGLRTLFDTAGLEAGRLTEEHIGFVLAPRLNALGRLDDANQAVEFLTTQDPARARLLATHLEGLNAQRRLLTEQVFQGVLAQTERDPSLLENPVLVFSHPEWPAGVIGIVASRLVERFNKPALLIAAPPGEAARGSARSIPGLNITDAISAHRELLLGFGGHPMAAGLSMQAERIPEFRRALGRTVQAMRGATPPQPVLSIDAELPLSALSLEQVEALERLAPFGPGNPPLVFAARDVHIAGRVAVGRNDEHLQLVIEDSQGETYRVVWWQGAGWSVPEAHFDLAYTARSSMYRGEPGVQIEWVDARPIEEPGIASVRPASTLEIVDRRNDEMTFASLPALNFPQMLVWVEGGTPEPASGVDRLRLLSAETLAIWTIPPGPEELARALETVSPRRVILFAHDPRLDTLQAFLSRLGGLVKHTLRARQGHAWLDELAAAAAHRNATLRLGLEWMQARGQIRITLSEAGDVHIEVASQAPSPDLEALTARLRQALQETAAYRAYYRTTDAQALLVR